MPLLFYICQKVILIWKSNLVTKKAFQTVDANMLFISISSDWLYPTDLFKEMVSASMKNNKHVSFCEVQSDYGHDSFLIECEKFAEIIKPFLESQT